MNVTENKIRVFNLIVVFCVLLIISILYVFSIISLRHYFAFLLAGVYTTGAFFTSIFYIKKTDNKQLDKVIEAIFPGMGLRLLVLMLLVIITIKFLDINKNSFIFSILIFYIYYLTIQIIYLCIRR